MATSSIYCLLKPKIYTVTVTVREFMSVPSYHEGAIGGMLIGAGTKRFLGLDSPL